MGNSRSGLIGEVTGGRRRYNRQQQMIREAAAQEKDKVRKEVAKVQEELNQQKAAATQQLKNEANEAKRTIDNWRSTSLQQIIEAETTKKNELKRLEQKLRQDHQDNLQNINNEHEAQLSQLNTNKIAAVKYINQQYQLSIELSNQAQSINNEDRHNIDRLNLAINQATKGIDNNVRYIYKQLISPSTVPGQKISYYSHLVAYLDDLRQKQQLTEAEHTNYKMFLQTACFYELDLTTTDVCSINAKLEELFNDLYDQQNLCLDNAYRGDLAASECKQHNQQQAIYALQQYWQEQELELSKNYGQIKTDLIATKDQQITDLTTNLHNALTTINLERAQLVTNDEQATRAINLDYAERIEQIDSQLAAEIAKIETNHTQQMGVITAKLTQAMTEINGKVAGAIKRIKSRERINTINFLIVAPLTLAGAYFAPALFTVSTTTLAAIQNSLAATGLSSLLGGLNNSGTIGVHVKFSIALGKDNDQGSDNAPKVQRPEEIRRPVTLNLQQFEQRYSATVTKILNNKSNIANKLYYQLLKPVYSSPTFNRYTPCSQLANLQNSSSVGNWAQNDFDVGAVLYRSQSQGILTLYQHQQVRSIFLGATQTGAGVGQLFLAGTLAKTGVGVIPAGLFAARGVDNLVAGVKIMLTGQAQPTMFHQVARRVGIKDTTANWLEFGIDVSSCTNPAAFRKLLTNISKQSLGRVDLVAHYTSRQAIGLTVKTGSYNLRANGSKLPHKFCMREVSSTGRVATATSITLSTEAGTVVFPWLNQENMLKYIVPGGGLGVLTTKAIHDTTSILTKQEFSRNEQDFAIPGFRPVRSGPTIFITPAHNLGAFSSSFPAKLNTATILPGPAIEVKKPLIFTGGIDYKDREFLDSLNILTLNHVNPDMFDKIRSEVEWTTEQTFTWRGLKGRVKTSGNVEIQDVQVHHVIPQEFKDYKIIELSGFNLEDHVNKMILPNKKGADISGMDSSIHQGRHSKVYTDEIESQLKAVQQQAQEQGWYDLPKEEFEVKCQQEICNRINKIRIKLDAGDLPLNKLGSNKINNLEPKTRI